MSLSLFACIEWLLLLFTLALPTGSYAGEFLTYATYPYVGGHFATGDFNGDGRADMAVASGSLSVLIAKSDGTFAKPVKYAVGVNPFFVAVGDVNGDGKPDIVVANRGNPRISEFGTLSILLGKGDGSFRKAITYTPGSVFPIQLTLGDINGDGKLDIALLSLNVSNEHQVDILLGSGDGTFRSKASFSGMLTLVSVLLSDLNHDNKLDMLELYKCVRNCGDGAVTILLGNGDGTFKTGTSYQTAVALSVAMVSGDFNGDGNLDVVVGGSSGMSILLGNGDGTFQSTVKLPCCIASSMVVGDLNRDNKLDVAVAGGAALELLKGNGDGTFQSPAGYDQGAQAVVVDAADFRGDGNLDVVAYDHAKLSLNVALGNGDGTLQAPGSFPASGGPMISADFNKDGNADVAAAINGGVVEMLGNGDGTLNPPSGACNFGAYGRLLRSKDFNNDHNLDLAARNGTKSVAICLGNGDGTFQPGMNFFAGGSTEMDIADFDGDGQLDLAVPTGGLVNILLGNGDGTFQSPTNAGQGTHANYVVAGDFNRDGKSDLVVLGKNTYILLGKGDGTFQKAKTIAPTGISVRIGDFNNDGKLDLAILTSSTVSILLGNGNGTFRAAKVYGSGAFSGEWGIKDFNGDGSLDIALLNSGDLSILAGKGDGTFQPQVNYPVGGAQRLVIGEFNHDGAPDLAFYRGNIDTVVLLNSRGTLINLVSSSNSAVTNHPITFSVTLTASVSGAGTPEGIVILRDGANMLGVAILNNGNASITTTALKPGKHMVGAFYSGNARFNPHASAVLLQTVMTP